MDRLDAERERQRAFIERLPAIAAELTMLDAAGGRWSVEPLSVAQVENNDTHYRHLISQRPHENIGIRIDGWQKSGKIDCSGQYGELPDGQNWYVSSYGMPRPAKNPEATITQAKSDKQIAADIYRRIVCAGYRDFLAQYADCIARQRDHREVLIRTARAAVEASSGMLRLPSTEPRYSGSTSYLDEAIAKGRIGLYSNGGGGTIEIHGETITYEGSITLDELRAIMARRAAERAADHAAAQDADE